VIPTPWKARFKTLTSSGQARREWMLLLLLATSAGLNVAQARRIHKLGTALDARAAEARLAEGDVVPSLSVHDHLDRASSISFHDTAQPTVLYFLSVHCPWCDRNNANLTRLVTAAESHYRIIIISRDTENPAAYMAQRNLRAPVYYRLAESAKLKLGITPQTIVVSSQGRVLKNWYGAYSGPLQREIESYFNVELPGLTDVAQPAPRQ
jgi:peroxiredoxin